ncbi:MAG TPA: FGGY family carbohydrate kinase [Dehalococcoidales bacterium]|nr:FGGY family carbohydrate kinase [Dehalococcoidales bacterium]
MANKRLSLGLDLSTQSLSAVLIDIDARTIVQRFSLDYQKDSRLKKYGIQGEDYILPSKNKGEANQPPKMFLAALDALFSDMKTAGLPMRDILVCNTSAQQHGHAYLSRQARTIFGRLNVPGSTQSNLVTKLEGCFSLNLVPTWMTSDTVKEADFIRTFIGGQEKMIQISGSDSPARFTGAVIRKIAVQYPEAYQETEHIHLLSSLIPAVLTGNSRVPLDFGNACGMSMMDYLGKDWSIKLVKAVAEGLPGGESTLRNKLLPIVPPYTIVGRIATYFIERYGFSPDCRIIAGSGDNPQSKVLVTGNLLSLGSSFVNMASTDGKHFDMSGASNAMYDGIGRPFIFSCRTNGALVWDQLRVSHGLKKDEYQPAEKALKETPLGKFMVFWQPRSESFPVSGSYDIIRTSHNAPDLGPDYSGLIESTLGTVYLYSKIFAKESAEPIYVTGGANKSPEILRRVAAIWNKPVVRIEEAGAALGAAAAGAYALLKTTGKEVKIEEINKKLLKSDSVIHPLAADVNAYHGSGGYLEKLSITADKIIKEHKP